MGLFSSIGDFFGGEKFGQYQSIADRQEGNLASLIQQLRGASQGKVPSAAEIQSRQAMQQAQAGAQSLAASARPGQGALAMRLAARQQQQLASKEKGSMAALRAQEQATARGQLAETLAKLKQLQVQQAGGSLNAPTSGDIGRGVLMGALGGLL